MPHILPILRYTLPLQHVDWSAIISNEIPLLAENRVKTLLHVGGQLSINPALLMTKIIMEDENTLRFLKESDEEFRKRLIFFADGLSGHDQDYKMEKMLSGRSLANTNGETGLHGTEYALRKMFSDTQTIEKFIHISSYLIKKHDIPKSISKDLMRNEENNDIKLDLPYPLSECWQLSGTHFGAQHKERVSKI